MKLRNSKIETSYNSNLVVEITAFVHYIQTKGLSMLIFIFILYIYIYILTICNHFTVKD